MQRALTTIQKEEWRRIESRLSFKLVLKISTGFSRPKRFELKTKLSEMRGMSIQNGAQEINQVEDKMKRNLISCGP